MVYIIAHRGCSSETPENTMASIKKAIEIGVDLIEIDLHLTKDLIPVVIHDSDLNRTSNFKSILKIEMSNLDELQNVDVGSWFDANFTEERLPTLKEVLELDFKGAKLMLEIKKDHLAPEVIVPPILEVVRSSSNSQQHYFGSFHPGIVKEVIKNSREAKIIGILENLEMIDTFLRMKVSTLAIWQKILNPQAIRSLKAQNIEIFSFTVNDFDRYQELLDLGIDGIITDNPRMTM